MAKVTILQETELFRLSKFITKNGKTKYRINLVWGWGTRGVQRSSVLEAVKQVCPDVAGVGKVFRSKHEAEKMLSILLMSV